MPQAGSVNQLKGVTKQVARTVGVERQARWMWQHRPGTGKDRRFQSWLVESDRRDNARMRLVMASVLHSSANCIDIGAGQGDVLADMHQLAPEGRHIAYEPLPEPTRMIEARFPKALVRCCAVSNTNGRTAFSFVSNSSGWSGLRPYEYGTSAQVEEVQVDVVRLDDDLPVGYRPDLIKVDVNGAEVELFEGAIRTITEAKPVILFEHGLAVRGYEHDLGDVYPVLAEECGLRIFDLDGKGPFSRSQFVDVMQTEAKWNFLARP
jgi:FkbM family methyltransferase